jgi:hypothetical protein
VCVTAGGGGAGGASSGTAVSKEKWAGLGGGGVHT